MTTSAASDADKDQIDRLSSRGSAILLLVSIFLIAVCGLVYELLAGTLSTYLLGNSITQFSFVIGLFLTAMGIGSFLSRFITKNLIKVFLAIEILIGLVGGSLTLILFFAFAVLDSYHPLLTIVSFVVGSLVGLEIPLLIRILRTRTNLRTTLGNVLSVDYLGALAASLLFPLILVPHLGLVRTGFLFGLMNVGVAFLGLMVFRKQIKSNLNMLRFLAITVALILLTGLVTAGKTTTLLEDILYEDEIVYAKNTPYQRIVLTRWRGDLRLFIDGNIQFSSADEFRYHEALVHPAMGSVHSVQNVLILGGGDGLAAREVYKYPTVKSVHLIDLDPEITRIFSKIDLLIDLNKKSLLDARTTVYNQDAQKFLEQTKQQYDVIIIDLPDPNNESLGKLYTKSFYRLVAKHLSPVGVMVTQATSPFYSTEAYWCIVNTIQETDLFSNGPKLNVMPYHADVPSFGDWGFALASMQLLSPTLIKLSVSTQFLTPELLPSLFIFPKDIGPRKTPINKLGNQILVKLYEKGFRRYNK